MSESERQIPPVEVPTGLAHIDMIARFNQRNRALAQSLLQAHRDDLDLLGEHCTSCTWRRRVTASAGAART